MRDYFSRASTWLRDARKKISFGDHGQHAPQYYAMMVQMDQDIGMQYAVLAGGFSWLLLAGFLLSPATYASARYVDTLEKTGLPVAFSIGAIRNVPIIVLACVACLTATSGLGWLWRAWHHNFIWTSRYIIM